MEKFQKAIYGCGLSVRPEFSVGYSYRIDSNHRRSAMPMTNFIKGTLSTKSQSRIKQAVDWMVFLSEGQIYFSKKTKQKHKLMLNFITLTLSQKQMHSDSFIVTHMLQPFLKWIERKGNELYIWKAETQTNGNIHFHITTNKFIEWKSIRDKWNKIQYAHDYLKNYFTTHGTFDANSTDIKGVKNIKKVAAYISKYMSKDGKDRRKIESKIWGCSRILSQINLNFNEDMKDWNSVKTIIESNSEAIQKEKYKLFIHKPSEQIKGLINHFLSTT